MRSGSTQTAEWFAASVDQADLARFERLGAAWWDERGPMAALHRLNPTRIRFIRDAIVRHFGRNAGANTPGGALPLAGLTLLDIGCGGGLLAEPLARLGAIVTAVDPAASNIAIAEQHAEAVGLTIDYRATTVEQLAEGEARFDVVIASEVIEHVVDQPRFVATAAGLVRPGGVFVATTLNRTAKSFLLAIVGAEYVLRWLPRGTHRWDRFVTPEELSGWLRRDGFRVLARRGMIYNPLGNEWQLGSDTDVNYCLAAARPSSSAPEPVDHEESAAA